MSLDTPYDWSEIETAFDRLLDMSEAERAKTMRAISKTNPAMGRELEDLLRHTNPRTSLLDRPAFRPVADAPSPGLEAGSLIGAYRIVSPLGRGGMGEVYLAERFDGQFDQQVALKVIRREAIDNMVRFQFERQTLARLQHPNITHVHDGGILEDGRPYMVMELVAGQPITIWCRQHESDLDSRLDLFLAVCKGVAHAHRSLIVHRDIKPSNVLVSTEGAVKVLDFGVAKQISDDGSLDTKIAPATPSYAAPEQLTGGTIGTATDTYALGLLLFELLAGERPWTLETLPLAAAVDLVLNQPAPSLAKFAAALSGAPIPARILAGDLDAIVAKALRKEPDRRYQTVESLVGDIERYRAHLPVSAREGTRAYLAKRFIRRHRLPLAAASVSLIAIIAGLVGVSAEYLRAEKEATRATTIKSFLQDMFNASDPHFPTDKPRNQVTATDLIALSLDRIDRAYANNPEMSIELLHTIGTIYDNMSEFEKGSAVVTRELEQIAALQGNLSRDYLANSETLFTEQFRLTKFDDAQKTLDTIDPLITRAGLDDSNIRAMWWMQKGQLLTYHFGNISEGLKAYDKSIDLFLRFAPHNPFYPAVLIEAGSLNYYRGDYQASKTLYQRALAELQDPKAESDPALNAIAATARGGLAVDLTMLGDIAGADRQYREAAEIALRAGGVSSATYMQAVSTRAYILHLDGARDAAMALFDDLRTQIGSDVKDAVAADVQRYYGQCLASEGRADLAIPILEAVLARKRAQKRMDSSALASMLVLGDAYDRVGRTDDARALLQEANGLAQAAGPDSPAAVKISGRWARFLLDHGAPDAAKPILDTLIAKQDRWTAIMTIPAQAWSDRARAALAAGDIGSATEASDMALELYDKVKASHDVRDHARLLLTHGAVMLAAGNTAQAAKDAGTALAESRRTDAPESPAIRQAEILLAKTQMK